ncbi:MAG: HD-GYP domain-containing protein, partial [Candidatus Hinthialibacter sp.]
PLGSRIIAVANAYATLLNRWSEEDRQSSEKAFQVIKKLANRSYDPDIVNALHQAIVDPIEDTCG